ncbi:MAG: hypothetical protein EOP56_09135 [Sphingobacteriales bacterium]|nr:MAG: hypothetical protein EOP56_09135 [Sphingobacteriales bacterium]
MDRYFLYLLGSIAVWPVFPLLLNTLHGPRTIIYPVVWPYMLWLCLIASCIMYYKYVSVERSGIAEYITYVFGTVVGFFLTMSVLAAVAFSVWGWDVMD